MLDLRNGQFSLSLTSSGCAIAMTNLLLVVTGFFAWYMITKSSKLQEPVDGSSLDYPMVPYRLPYIGHGLSLAWHPYAFLRKISGQTKLSQFRLKGFGVDFLVRINVGGQATLAAQIEKLGNQESMSWTCLSRAFNMGSSHQKSFAKAENIIAKQAFNGVDKEGIWFQSSLRIFELFEHDAPFLITFSSSPIDQLPWERASAPSALPPSSSSHILTGQGVLVSLPLLIRHFVGHVLLKGLLGSDFLELYPALCDDLYDLDKAFRWMILGIPRWVPLLGLLAAHIARRRLESGLRGFHRALDKATKGEGPDAGWTDIEDISNIMRSRSKSLHEQNVAEEVRLALDIDYIMALYIQISALTTWLVVHICSDPELLEDIRSETADFAKVTPADRCFNLPSPPRLDLDKEGLCKSCPLLKACLVQTLRLDVFPIATSRVGGGVASVNQEPESSSMAPRVPKSHSTSDGILVTLPDVSCPQIFNPRSSQRHESDYPGVAETRPLRPWSTPCAQGVESSLVADFSLSFAAGLLALWDFRLVSNHLPLSNDHLEFPAVVRTPSHAIAHIFRRSTE